MLPEEQKFGKLLEKDFQDHIIQDRVYTLRDTANFKMNASL